MSTKIQDLLRDLYRKERAMADHLQQLARRHPGHQEVYHVAQDIARWSHQHADRLTVTAKDYGLDLHAEEQPDPGRPVGEEALSTASGGAQLLEDLRAIYLHAADLSIDWELLGQGAQEVKDAELLGLSAQCHPGTLRQMRWANALLKAGAPQVLAS